MSACVSGASRGDTVQVTAGNGTAAWTTQLVLTKGISLLGPGMNQLAISSSGNLIAIEPDATAITNNESIRVSGFTLDGNEASLTLITVGGASATSTVAFRKLIIDNNRLRNTKAELGGNGSINSHGQVRGVIAKNRFDRQVVPLKVMGNDDKAEWTSGHFPFAYGNGDNLFFEDNVIEWTTTGLLGNGGPGWIESGQGSRVVMRYNTWNMQNSQGQDELWDVHGFQNWSNGTGGQTGTMLVEYYGNTINNKLGYRWLSHRGSWGLFFNNVVTTPSATGTSGSAMEMMQYDLGCNGVVQLPANIDGEINNTYGFNNSFNGNQIRLEIHVSAMVGNTCPPVENSTFWNQNAACTASKCDAGIGSGTTAPTGTCNPGTGYWVASTPGATVSSTVIQNATFYKCTLKDTWTAYYRPYTYPHPLRSGGTMDTTAPAAPVALTVQ